MFTPSDKCPRRDACVQNGKGLIHMKDLTDKEGLYNHGRLFAHVTVDPGCSIGDHPHDHETEFYYIIKGEGVFNDNGKEIVVRPGDICATGYGEVHGLENRGTEPVELIALIVGELNRIQAAPGAAFYCPEKNFPLPESFFPAGSYPG